jgi:hypothetical protein
MWREKKPKSTWVSSINFPPATWEWNKKKLDFQKKDLAKKIEVKKKDIEKENSSLD